MDIYVVNNKTNECWVLDNDSSKPVYNDEFGNLVIDLKSISKFRFLLINPNMLDQSFVFLIILNE